MRSFVPGQRPESDAGYLEMMTAVIFMGGLNRQVVEGKWDGFLTGFEQFEVEKPMSYLLTFSEDGSVAIKADCNNAAGDYTDDAGGLTIEVGPTQLALCPSESRGEQFLQLLVAAKTARS